MSTKQKNLETINTKYAFSVPLSELFNKDREVKVVSPKTFSNVVRSLLQGWRQGTVAVKGRADVSYSGKKPWKQKGTGRARAGTRRSPLWRGGGVVFGPQKRVRTLKVGKKLRSKVSANLLYYFLQQGRVVQIDWEISADKPRTAYAFKALKEAGLQDKKIVFFLSKDDMITGASFANIPTVNIVFFDQANVFDLSSADYWVFLKKDLSLFKEMVSEWI